MDKSPSLRLAFGSIRHAIQAVDPARLIKSSLKLRNGQLSIHDIKHQRTNIDLKSFDHIYLIGAGKATARMARALRQIIGDRVSGGAITVPYGTNENVENISVTHASHPIPDVSGVKGTKRMIEILRKTTPADLVIVLISGGGSSLMPLPSKNLSLKEKQAVTSSLILLGASIEEVNTVRKHLSQIKGGQLLRYMNKECRLVSLIISDVINDKLSVIASGPTCPDPSTYKDARRVLRKYGLWNEKHREAKNVIVQGLRRCEIETPKPGDSIFQRATNLLIGNNAVACTAAEKYLKRRRVEAHTLGTAFNGEAWRFGGKLAILARDLIGKDRPFAFVLGGETVVKIDRTNTYGVGGRNQEAVLAAAINLQDFYADQDITVLCAGTDGIDGNSEAAGAFLNPQVMSNIQQKNLDARYFLKTHNSYCFFKQINSLIITGQTGTNVNDISVVCKIK
jgi:glycerate 2-kinase